MRIHLLGIGGTGMGSLAGLMVEAGHDVTGTDEKLYPPMSDVLSELKIVPFEGFSASNVVRARPDMVIIGNVIRRENPEALEVMRLGIPYRSMPEALSELFLKGRTPVVVAGTHGKTTTSALLAWLLESAGQAPGFLIGGVGLNFGKSHAAGKGQFFVVEGDEYDTAFFDKGPKFLHYMPRALILTSIEFDHADIYRDLEGVMESFRRLISMLSPNALLIANADDENVRAVVAKALCRVVTYGLNGGTYRPLKAETSADGTSFTLCGRDQRFSIPMWGTHNLSNAAGALAIMIESGFEPESIASGLKSFKGVRRRQEIAGIAGGVTVVDDFAHHPTAVMKTIESMRLRFPARRVWAIFEPRSNTSRRRIFQQEFSRALATADSVVVAEPYRASAIPDDERFDSREVASAIMGGGVDAHCIPDVDHIVEFVMRGVHGGDVILVMSNGGFGGIVHKLLSALKKATRDLEALKLPGHGRGD